MTRDIKPPAPAEVARLFVLAQEDDSELAVYVVMAAATGARRSEVLALRWRDLDLDAGIVRIERAIVMGPRGPVEKDTKTHAARTVSLDPMTPDHAPQAPRAGHGTGRVVQGEDRPDGVRLQPRDRRLRTLAAGLPTRAFVRLCRRAGLEGVRLHDLRHYVATRLQLGTVALDASFDKVEYRATVWDLVWTYLPERLPTARYSL